MEAYLEHTIGVTNQTVRTNLINSGISTLEALTLRDESFIETACTNTRKAGAQVATRDVPAIVETRLKLLVNWCKFRYMIQRPLEFGVATLAALEAIGRWSMRMASKKEFPEVDKFTDNCKRRIWLESIQKALKQTKGYSGGSLAYVVRREPNLPAVDRVYTDPGEELEARGRLDGIFWAGDNEKVWLFLESLCHGTTAWSTIRAFGARNNGRGAYLALLNHYMGENYVHVTVYRARDILQTAVFNNRSKNYTWDKFVNRMHQAFEDLGPEEQPPEHSKVATLCNAFQVEALQHCTSTVAACPTRSNDFEAAVAFFGAQLSALQTKNRSNTRNVSAFGRTNSNKKSNSNASPKNGGHSKGFDPNNLAEYVDPELWKAWTDDEKKQARDARRAAGIPSGRNRNRNRKRKVAALSTRSEPCSDDAADSCEPTPGNAPALTQRKSGKGKSEKK